MESNPSLDSIEEERTSLPHLVLIVLIFFTVSGLISYVYFKDILLVSEGRAEDFVFRNFLVYNFGLKVILFPFKFMGMTLLFMLGAFLFKIENLEFITVLKVVILAELIKYLPEISKIFWFSFVDSANLEGYDLATFDDYFSLNGLIGITKKNTIYTLLDYVSLVEVAYILGVARLFQMTTGTSYGDQLKWSSITYFSYILIIGLVFTLISL